MGTETISAKEVQKEIKYIIGWINYCGGRPIFLCWWCYILDILYLAPELLPSAFKWVLHWCPCHVKSITTILICDFIYSLSHSISQNIISLCYFVNRNNPVDSLGLMYMSGYASRIRGSIRWIEGGNLSQFTDKLVIFKHWYANK